MLQTNENIEIFKRLDAVKSLVPKGTRLLDIGTDHAYIPIFLMESGKIEYAVASDINEGPYMRALLNIREHNLEKKITAVRFSDMQ